MGFFSGLFGRRERPDIHIPSAQELQQQQFQFLQGIFPQFMRARETGLGRLMGGAFGQDIGIEPIDFAQFGPTSFEEALGAQHFQNVFPGVERQIRQGLSLSGMAASPALAQLTGQARGELGVDIGQYLTGIGQQRGMAELERRIQEAGLQERGRQFDIASLIGQDPFPDIFAGGQLGAQQAQRLGQEQLARFEAEPDPAGSSILALLGGAGGFMLGGPMGASIGASLGGGLGSAFGGGPSPSNFGDIGLMSLLGGGGGFGGGGFGGFGGFGGGGGFGGFGGGGIGQGQAMQNLFGRTLPIGGGF